MSEAVTIRARQAGAAQPADVLLDRFGDLKAADAGLNLTNELLRAVLAELRATRRAICAATAQPFLDPEAATP